MYNTMYNSSAIAVCFDWKLRLHDVKTVYVFFSAVLHFCSYAVTLTELLVAILIAKYTTVYTQYQVGVVSLVMCYKLFELQYNFIYMYKSCTKNIEELQNPNHSVLFCTWLRVLSPSHYSSAWPTLSGNKPRFSRIITPERTFNRDRSAGVISLGYYQASTANVKLTIGTNWSRRDWLLLTHRIQLEGLTF